MIRYVTGENKSEYYIIINHILKNYPDIWQDSRHIADELKLSVPEYFLKYGHIYLTGAIGVVIIMHSTGLLHAATIPVLDFENQVNWKKEMFVKILEDYKLRCLHKLGVLTTDVKICRLAMRYGFLKQE